MFDQGEDCSTANLKRPGAEAIATQVPVVVG